MSAVTRLITDQRMLEHEPGRDIPETPARLRAILDRLREQPGNGTDAASSEQVRWATAPPASRDDLLLVHTQAHVDLLESLRGKSSSLDWDTNTSPATVDCALLAAGSGIRAVDAVLTGEARNAFALVRPPGHHAEPQRAMGFCFFNNIAIAAAHAIARRGLERVLIVDWDVHHGNGTQAAFYACDDVLVFDTHQHPLYPGTGGVSEAGRGAGEGYTVNCPLPAGCGDGIYYGLFEHLLAPLARTFSPELILVSAGFDAHERDPLGSMKVTTDGFGAMCGIVNMLAAELCHGRVVLMLEGGYDLEALAGGSEKCVKVLGRPVADSPWKGGTSTGEVSPPPPDDDEQRLIDRFLAMHARWVAP